LRNLEGQTILWKPLRSLRSLRAGLMAAEGTRTKVKLRKRAYMKKYPVVI
jgi:hypothetical protein